MKNNNHSKKAQLVYLSHGGGPLPILGDAGHKAIVAFMQGLSSRLRRPDAILVISAHWEETEATLLGAQNPPLLYDYYGFPKEAYQITYPAPGNPDLAHKIVELLHKEDIPSRIDAQRGYDHGLFIPLKLMYPEADIPALQISLLRSLDPKAHICLGKALKNLMDQNILVVGSGFSFHNLGEFFARDVDESDPRNDAFQNWLVQVCAGANSQIEREQKLIEWEKAPNARYCHPREEHLLPLHVCVGMAGSPAQVIFDDRILGKRALAFLWN